jgi:Rieske Fe-S protein
MQDMNRREFVAATAAAVATTCLLCSGADQALADDKSAPNTSIVDAGPLDKYQKDGAYDSMAAKNQQQIMLVVQDGKLFAESSKCTHRNCYVQAKDDTLFCKCHGSKFSLEGSPTKGPAKFPLSRLAISLDDKNHVIVDKSKKIDEKDWDKEGNFIPMKKA